MLQIDSPKKGEPLAIQTRSNAWNLNLDLAK